MGKGIGEGVGEGLGVGVGVGLGWPDHGKAEAEISTLGLPIARGIHAVAFLPPHAPLVCMRHAPCRSMRLEEEIGDFYGCGLQLADGQCFSACSLKSESVESGIFKW